MKQTWGLILLLGLSMWLSAIGHAQTSLGDCILVQTFPDQTIDGKPLIVVGAKQDAGCPLTLAGMAIDRQGNIYVSDQGPGDFGRGSIIMIPAPPPESQDPPKKRIPPLRILYNLTRPGDVELSPDQRALIIGQQDAKPYVRWFGISVRVSNVDVTKTTTVTVISDTGGVKSRDVPVDGYYHFPNLLGPGQDSATKVEVSIEHDGETHQEDVSLAPSGQTIKEVTFESHRPPTP